jgi:surfactin synthase thioesterase subunit
VGAADAWEAAAALAGCCVGAADAWEAAAAVVLAGRCVRAADAWEAAAALDGSCVGAADAWEVAAAARKTQVHSSVRNWHRSEGK